MRRKQTIIAAACLAFVTVFAVFMTTAFALGPSSDEIYNGIDVSKYQGNIDFERVANDGIEVVYIRTGAAGDYEDPFFEQNYSRAKAAGLRIGFYHSVAARNVSEAHEQAEFFVNLIRGKEFECAPAMDLESRFGLSNAAVNDIAVEFLETVRSLTGKNTVIYTDASGARTVWNSRVAELAGLWVADYGPSEPNADGGPWESWDGFQYTDTGRVDGIEGNVDRDRFTSNIFLENTSSVPGQKIPPVSNTKRIVITVQRGDTLSKLAARYGTTVQTIARENNITNVNLIRVGEKLYINGDIDKVSGECADTYTVQRGDTLGKIARRFGTTVQKLAAVNKIRNENLIFPGQVIELGDCSGT